MPTNAELHRKVDRLSVDLQGLLGTMNTNRRARIDRLEQRGQADERG